MKTITVAVLTALLAGSSVFAESGIFGSGVVIDNDGTLTLYETTLLGDSRHNPSGASPALNTAGWGTTASPSPNLGAFDTGAGDTLTFKGGGLLTYKNGLSDVFGANVYYKIDDGSYSSAIFLSHNENLGGGDQRWYSDSSSVDLLAGLDNGTHSISIYFDASSSDGTHFENNGTADFATSFDVIPEPSVLGFMVVIGSGTLFIRRYFVI